MVKKRVPVYTLKLQVRFGLFPYPAFAAFFYIYIYQTLLSKATYNCILGYTFFISMCSLGTHFFKCIVYHKHVIATIDQMLNKLRLVKLRVILLFQKIK